MLHATDSKDAATAKTRIWLLAVVPWVAVAALAAVFGASDYADGRNFVKALHAFKFLPQIAAIAGAYIVTFVIGIVLVIAYWGRLSAARRGRLAAILLALSPVAAVASVRALPWAFDLGRRRAYATLDYEAICRDAWRLQQPVEPDGQIVYSETSDIDRLPDAIRKLAPTYVFVWHHAAIINMDGGGPMYHEGIGIAFTNDASTRQALAERFEPLHPSLPVFLYRLYDGRMFADAVPSTGPASRPTNGGR